ncbi:cobalt-precorrin-6A reductase [Sciscionella marina]|uniref:cobalt-precorrin-6A reductase n=1 Tax=Sciscionella marina TaxID=508770 RepID=UPI00037701D1|nr:cobalt-precorrin-6A reductase [Sciscionella marina]
MRLLLLGGTGEARELAAAVSERVRVTSSLAGRVSEPKLPVGEVRIGGFGGVDGLVDYLRTQGIDAIVDATHPFARTISEHAALASARTGVPLLLLRRPGWQQPDGADWHWAENTGQAAQRIDELADRAFLTTGRGGLAAFADVRAWLLIRCVEAPEPPLPTAHRILLDRGPYTVDSERELLRRFGIQLLVTKDSGGSHTSAKLEAARTLEIPVLVLARPAPPDVPSVAAVPEAVDWLSSFAG